MTPSTRYSLVGCAGLALLTTAHWLRAHAAGGGPVAAFVLGVTPNFAAALAITFVVLGIWADRNPAARRAVHRRAFVGASAFSGAGLAAWEFLQLTNAGFVFDPYDLAATALGLAAGAAAFAVLPSPDDP